MSSRTGRPTPTRNAFTRRLHILSVTYRDHRFERRSPLAPLSEQEMKALLSVDLTFPPRRDLGRPGMQTVDGLFALGSLAALVEARRVFEIGTFRGMTCWFLARNLPEAEVHTLDIPPDEQPSFELEASDEFRGRPETLFYAQRGDAPNIVQHWSDSARFDFTPWRNSCDLIYIDGAHSEPYVRSDSRNAFDMLSHRGVIVWDDYWRNSPGTVAVLHGLAREGIELRRIPGTRLVFHARPVIRDRLQLAASRGGESNP
jgi:predicted O-methyltransferase YrrM